MSALSISTSQDLLAYIPATLGFWPSESIAVLAITADSTAGAVLRADLSPAVTHPDGAALHIAELVANAEPAKTVAAIYTAEPFKSGQFPHLEVALALMAHLPDCQTVFWVSPDKVRSYMTGDAFTTDEVKASPMALDAMFSGRNITPDCSVEIPEADFMSSEHEETIEAVTQALVLAGTTTTGGEGVIKLWDAVLNEQRITTKIEIALLATLKNHTLRDVAMATMISSQLPDPSNPEKIGRRCMGATHTTPEWDRIDKAQTILNDLLVLATGHLRAEPLALLGAFEWHKGRGTAATQYLKAGLAENPEHRLSSLLLEVCTTAVLSPWAKNPSKAYRQN